MKGYSIFNISLILNLSHTNLTSPYRREIKMKSNSITMLKKKKDLMEKKKEKNEKRGLILFYYIYKILTKKKKLTIIVVYTNSNIRNYVLDQTIELWCLIHLVN